jgi:hypothetical protein
MVQSCITNAAPIGAMLGAVALLWSHSSHTPHTSAGVRFLSPGNRAGDSIPGLLGIPGGLAGLRERGAHHNGKPEADFSSRFFMPYCQGVYHEASEQVPARPEGVHQVKKTSCQPHAKRRAFERISLGNKQTACIILCRSCGRSGDGYASSPGGTCVRLVCSLRFLGLFQRVIHRQEQKRQKKPKDGLLVSP